MSRPLEAFGAAFARTRHVLFEPFDAGKYLALAFCIWLFRFGSAGGTSSGSMPRGGSSGAATPEFDPASVQEALAPILAMGALLGVIFGLPSLRLRGLYLAVSTLALHFLVVYLGGEYETKRGFSTGIVIDPPSIGGIEAYGGRVWYFVLGTAAAGTLLLCLDLLRSGTGRAWAAIRANETVAEALGIGVAAHKLLAFVISSALAALAGALFAYYRGFVSVEAFSLFLSIQYVAMIIIGGMGSLLGAILGAIFVTLFPYAIEAALRALPGAQRYAGSLFAVNYAAFGFVMILFLVLEPLGLVGIWRRVQTYFLMWPFKYRPMVRRPR